METIYHILSWSRETLPRKVVKTENSISKLYHHLENFSQVSRITLVYFSRLYYLLLSSSPCSKQILNLATPNRRFLLKFSYSKCEYQGSRENRDAENLSRLEIFGSQNKTLHEKNQLYRRLKSTSKSESRQVNADYFFRLRGCCALRICSKKSDDQQRILR